MGLRELDLVVNFHILQTCVSGFSNAQIAERYDLDEDFVKNTIKLYLDFEGFDKPFFTASPWYVYKSSKKDRKEFYKNMREYILNLEDVNPKELFSLLRRFEDLKEVHDGITRS
jgi:hypothetical protein